MAAAIVDVHALRRRHDQRFAGLGAAQIDPGVDDVVAILLPERLGVIGEIATHGGGRSWCQRNARRDVEGRRLVGPACRGKSRSAPARRASTKARHVALASLRENPRGVKHGLQPESIDASKDEAIGLSN